MPSGSAMILEHVPGNKLGRINLTQVALKEHVGFGSKIEEKDNGGSQKSRERNHHDEPLQNLMKRVCAGIAEIACQKGRKAEEQDKKEERQDGDEGEKEVGEHVFP